MIPVDAQTLFEIAPRFSGAAAERQREIVTAVGEVLAPTLEAYGIDTRLRIAHFLAQTCHESAGFRTTQEFASGEAYEGRADLGNTRRGDGRRYKGRGLLQLTGRANYREFGQALGVDLENDPEAAAEPVLSLKIACEFWKRRGINAHADRDDVIAVTRVINGGINGLDDRRKLTAKAKAALARLEALSRPGSADRPVLGRGSRGEAVARLQGLLQAQGFMLAIDGDFGPATEVAVAAMQARHGLAQDGIVTPELWEILEKAPASRP
jgi:putative chitinase